MQKVQRRERDKSEANRPSKPSGWERPNASETNKRACTRGKAIKADVGGTRTRSQSDSRQLLAQHSLPDNWVLRCKLRRMEKTRHPDIICHVGHDLWESDGPPLAAHSPGVVDRMPTVIRPGSVSHHHEHVREPNRIDREKPQAQLKFQAKRASVRQADRGWFFPPL